MSIFKLLYITRCIVNYVKNLYVSFQHRISWHFNNIQDSPIVRLNKRIGQRQDIKHFQKTNYFILVAVIGLTDSWKKWDFYLFKKSTKLSCLNCNVGLSVSSLCKSLFCGLVGGTISDKLHCNLASFSMCKR